MIFWILCPLQSMVSCWQWSFEVGSRTREALFFALKFNLLTEYFPCSRIYFSRLRPFDDILDIVFIGTRNFSFPFLHLIKEVFLLSKYFAWIEVDRAWWLIVDIFLDRIVFEGFPLIVFAFGVEHLLGGEQGNFIICSHDSFFDFHEKYYKINR